MLQLSDSLIVSILDPAEENAELRVAGQEYGYILMEQIIDRYISFIQNINRLNGFYSMPKLITCGN